MAKIPRRLDDSAARVAEEAMPGWKAVKQTSAEPSVETFAAADYGADEMPAQGEAVMPSLDALKAKYLGGRDAGPASANTADAADVAASAADTTLVEMEAGPLKKTVAVSKRKKKVIWSQG